MKALYGSAPRLGALLTDAIPVDADRRGAASLLERACRGESFRRTETVGGASPRRVQLSLTPLRDEVGSVSGATLFATRARDDSDR
jgi:hypothetical protein